MRRVRVEPPLNRSLFKDLGWKCFRWVTLEGVLYKCSIMIVLYCIMLFDVVDLWCQTSRSTSLEFERSTDSSTSTPTWMTSGTRVDVTIRQWRSVCVSKTSVEVQRNSGKKDQRTRIMNCCVVSGCMQWGRKISRLEIGNGCKINVPIMEGLNKRGGRSSHFSQKIARCAHPSHSVSKRLLPMLTQVPDNKP